MGHRARLAGPETLTTMDLRHLPSVDKLLLTSAGQELVAQKGRSFVTESARRVIARLRTAASASPSTRDALEMRQLETMLRKECAARLQSRLRPVINLTGTVIHTNLGRSLLPQAAIERLLLTMGSPGNLEYDLETGGRGDRDDMVESLICEITGAQAATVVNNNAAAVMLTIAALARGREVVVSRGELVEIGGAFRLPDVMAMAGASLVEVGTTNRTHLKDYAQAIGERTALVMKVHTSNYRVQGFTASVGERELAQMCHAKGVPVATDLGSGSLIDLAAYGLPHEPTPQEALAAGCDVVTFSGDKLLGGPQAGLIVGSRESVDRIRKFPMKRALRVSKLPLVALEATLQLYLQPELLATELPTLRLLTRPLAQIELLARSLAPQFATALAPRYAVAVCELQSQIGSGSLPVDRLPSAGLAIAPKTDGKKGVGSALDALAGALRRLDRPVIGRVAANRLVLDLRCLESPGELTNQLGALREALGMERVAPSPDDQSSSIR